jgi:hypothetical protein
VSTLLVALRIKSEGNGCDASFEGGNVSPEFGVASCASRGGDCEA